MITDSRDLQYTGATGTADERLERNCALAESNCHEPTETVNDLRMGVLLTGLKTPAAQILLIALFLILCSRSILAADAGAISASAVAEQGSVTHAEVEQEHGLSQKAVELG